MVAPDVCAVLNGGTSGVMQEKEGVPYIARRQEIHSTLAGLVLTAQLRFAFKQKNLF